MANAETQLAAMIDRFDPAVAATGRDAIAWLRDRLPTADVLVYDNYNALAVGFSPNERSSQGIFSIAIYPRWASLFFLQGVGLDDPAGLLRGSGNVVRHIVLASAADLDQPEIAALIDQALAKAKLPLKPDGEGSLIIKSISAKQRPRRPN